MAAKFLKQSTAATIKLGPFLDPADGVTAEVALTIQKADVRISANGGNMAAASADQGASDAGAPHDELGYYDISLDATDTASVGRLKVMVSESGALPVWDEFMVVPANVYDSLVGGTDLLDTNAAKIAEATPTTYDRVTERNAIADAVAARFGKALTVDGTPAAGLFAASVLDSGLSDQDDFYNGLFLVFGAGAVNEGVPRLITDYAVVGDEATFVFLGDPGDLDEPFPAAPAAGDVAMIIGRA